MPNPKDVFDNPLQYLDFLQSTDFERQHFDWKEVKTNSKSQINTLKDKIKRCISAFANSSRAGGLVALGIADNGTIKGTQDVDEQTINSILQVTRDLSNHSTQVQEVELPNSDGKRLHLLYTPWAPNAICETIADFPKGWKRFGAQNLPLTEPDRDLLKREKRIVDFEASYCCPYDPDELDKNVVEEFKKAYLETRDAQYDDYTTERVLYQAGALTKENNKYAFTNAGFLFFASNPRRHFASAYVRVLRFEVDVEESRERGVTTFDKDFDGALPSIIRKLRTFFKDSALFRTIIRRSSHGGFIEDPEYPLFAVDEALINAAIHGDYGATTSIQCIAYRNGLVVENPGGIPQAVPQHFNLTDTVLDSVPRNRRIVDWMRLIKDEHGQPLVRALREGTRRMLQEMEKMGLPAPSYETTFTNTAVTLYNRLEERLEPHAYAHKSEKQHNTPSTPSEQGNTGKTSGFIDGSPSETVDHVNETSMDLSDLPNGWEWTTLQEICSTPQYGWTTKAATQGTLHLLRTTDITAGDVNWKTVPFCQEEPPDKEKYLLKTGDIVISRAGSVGYSYLVKNPQNAVFASYLIRFKPSPIINEDYLIFFLKSPDYWKTILKEKAGIALPNVNASKLKRIEVPLPPLSEQNRIVSKIENLFTQLDAAVDSLKKAQTQLQRYCQSILKAAFEGELTKEWRGGHSDSWGSMTLNEFITLESGARPRGGVRDILEGIPSLGGEHLKDDGSFRFEKVKYVPEEFFKSLNKGRIYPNDIIIVKDGATTGKTSFVDNDFPYRHAAVNEHLFIVRVNPEIVFPKFVFYYLFSSKGQEQVLSDFRGATVGGISRNFSLKVNVPIPSLLEQEQIVSELERHLSNADGIEATIRVELKRAERLRQSILKCSFSGELVPQDPDDEPASVLLEKIRDERKHQQPKRKKTKKKTKTVPNDTLPLFTLANLTESCRDGEK